MTTFPPDPRPDPRPGEPASAAALDAGDRLVDRIASGDLSARAWSEWSRRAGEDAAAWRTMAESLRDQLLLAEAAGAAADVADRVELPALAATSLGAVPAPAASPPPALAAPAIPAASADRHGSRARRAAPAAAPSVHRPLARARAAAGWMVSAMLVVLLVVMSPALGPPSGGSGRSGGSAAELGETPAAPGGSGGGAAAVPASLSAADALDLYLERGRDEGVVLEERPDLLMLDSRPTPDGRGYEVVYLRQILERTVVPELFVPTGRDPEGRPVLTRLARPAGAAF